MNLIGISYVNVVTLKNHRRNPFHNCFRNYNSTVTTFFLTTPFLFMISSIQMLKSKKDKCSKYSNLLDCQYSDLDVFYYNYFIWTTSFFLGLNFSHLDHGVVQNFSLNPDRMKGWPTELWVLLGALIGLIFGILGFLFWNYIIFNIWWIYLVFIGVLVLYFAISNYFA